MKIPQRFISCILIIILTGPHAIHPQTSSSLRYRITEDNIMEIMYEVEKSGTYIVSLQISTDGGKTFAPVPQHTDGDIGRCKLLQGTARIMWDLFQDTDHLEDRFLIMVEMVEPEKKPISKWIYVAGVLAVGGLIAGLQVSEDSQSITSSTLTPQEYGYIIVNGAFPK